MLPSFSRSHVDFLEISTKLEGMKSWNVILQNQRHFIHYKYFKHNEVSLHNLLRLVRLVRTAKSWRTTQWQIRVFIY